MSALLRNDSGDDGVHRYEWRPANDFKLWVDGPQFFPRMLECIAQAKKHVNIELYLIEEGLCTQHLVQALCSAAQRGVRVRCLFDGMGARALSYTHRKALLQSGAQVRWYNPINLVRMGFVLHRDHRKLLIIDEALGFVGGTGSSDLFWNPDKDESDWHEVMVEMKGAVIEDWQDLFDKQWQRCEHFRVWRPATKMEEDGASDPPMEMQDYGRVAYANSLQQLDLLHSLLRSLKSAKKRIWMATPYFIPTWRVRMALRRAARRGVDVRLLLAGSNTDVAAVRYAGQRYYSRLIKSGVKIFEYTPQFLHLKMVLVDDWVSVGSCNFDQWNLFWNLDANLEAMHQGLTESVKASFEKDFPKSKSIELAYLKDLPRRERFQIQIWGRFAGIFARLLRHSWK